MLLVVVVLFFFFFQAEDGIRDLTVTGVQTCALPICHLLGTSVAYGQIYIRDRFRCTSPVCSRRDVTPHHLQFRSAGGSDEPENTTSVCSWCHLCGVHGGRIRAVGTAERIRWELGAPGCPCLVVHGRERMAA